MERVEHQRYLASSNVQVFGQLLAHRSDIKLELGIQDSVDDHANLASIFETLGSVSVVGRRRYLVGEVYYVLASLKEPSTADQRTLASILWWIDQDAQGELERRARITLLVDIVGQFVPTGGLVVVDGNKTSAGFVENRRGRGDRTSALPVYIITPPVP
jgi:hypothetical protein